VDVDREKASLLGVNTYAVAGTLRTYFYGHETGETYWEGEDDYPIRFRLREEQRNSREIFDRLMVPSASGKMVRLSTVASYRDTAGPPEIQRKNKQRYVVVEANVHGRSLERLPKMPGQRLRKWIFLRASPSSSAVRSVNRGTPSGRWDFSSSWE